MTKKRQGILFDPRTRKSAHLMTLAHEFKDRHVIEEHFHDADQFVFASSGVMTVRTSRGIWVVPPQRAVWIPTNLPHSITMSGAVSMRTLYFPSKLVKHISKRCLVVNVSPLLKELIVHACVKPSLSKKNPKEKRLIEILIDLLEMAPSIPLQLPSPIDSRSKRVAEILLNDPGDARSLGVLCKDCGASKRTVERLFLEETEMTFGKWRQQLRLMHAVRLLAQGEKVLNAAIDAGYNSPSAFISMFRKALGTTPSQYFS